MPTPAIAHVSDTALWVASYRARETERADALFRDPLAGRLTGERGHQIARHAGGSRYIAWSVVIRTCIIDAFLRDLMAGGVDTVLNLGAGLDTRPYRLELPAALRWIEVDYPHLIDFKEERLREERPWCRLERVKLDLADHAARSAFLAKVNAEAANVAVLTEGVVPYFRNEDAAALAEDLRAQPHVRHWIVDYFAPQVVKHMRGSRMRRALKNAPMQFDPGDWFGFFAQHGWKPREVRYTAEVSEQLGRRVPGPWWMKLLRVLVPKEKRDVFRRFSGYLLMEPK